MHNLTLSAGTYLLVIAVSILGGAVFLSIGQALVGLLKNADSVNAAGRVLVIGLILLGTFGQSGTLGSTWESIARWSPVGAVMTLFAAVLKLSAWDTRDSLTLLACIGYIVVFAGIGIRWFQWDAR
jgi:ABC-2 type transport system permease protein